MKTALLVVSLFAAGLAVSAAPARQVNPPEAVAIVCFASGPTTAWVARPATRRDVRLFDWLSSGTKLAVGPGARLDLAFRNGRRYHLEAGASVTLGAEDLAASAGAVTALPSLPPLPRLAAIRPDDPPGRRIGAIRLRAGAVTGLYPTDGARVLADDASLSFSPVKGRPHLVRIRDADGSTLLEQETMGGVVVVPVGLLRPGAHYWWSVETVERTGPTRQAEGHFATLTQEEQADRDRFHDGAAGAADIATLLLAAEVDLALGLRAEGCRKLRPAVGKVGDDRLRQAMPDPERCLADATSRGAR